MSNAALQDFRTPANDQVRIPANIEAEQGLLGMMFIDNEAYHRVDGLKPDHFYEPFHGRLWAAISARVGKGVGVDPILLDETFANDPAYQELGGIRYLADMLDRSPPPVMAGDYAKEIIDIALKRELARIGGDAVQRIMDPNEDRSGRDLVAETEQRIFALGETTTAEGFKPFQEYLTSAVQIAAEAHQRDGGLSGLATGLIDLDRKLGGLHPTDLLILAGRPSMGKSALACNIGFHVANHYAFEPQPDGKRKTIRGGVVAFFSLEMSGEQLALRLLAEASGVSGDKIRKGEIDVTEFGRIRDAAHAIQSAPLHIDATGGLTIGKLAARARRLARTVGLDLIIVDYLQLVTVPGLKASDGRVQEVTQITMALKALAKELHVPVIALSQLSRKVEDREDKKPQLADLRESGSIEQDADVVMFVYRAAYYHQRAEPKEGTAEHAIWQDELNALLHTAEVIIGKQRHGPIGTVALSFNPDLTKFGNLARPGRDFAQANLPYKDAE